MRKSTKNGFTTMLSSLVIIMLVVIVVGFIFFRTDGLTTGYKEFYVKCGNDEIMADRSNFDIVLHKEYRFDIINEKDTILNSESSYSVKVVPNISSATTFNFKVDGVEHSYGDILSLTSGFVINAYDDYFTFCADYDLCSILQDFYHTDNVTDCPTSLDTDLPYFRLVISNRDNIVINVNFNLISE